MSEVQKVTETYESSGVKWVTAQEAEALRAGDLVARIPALLLGYGFPNLLDILDAV